MSTFHFHRQLIVLLLLPVCSIFGLSAEEVPRPVSVVSVTRSEIYDEIPLTGSVIARRVSMISPRVEGFVAEVLVDEGDYLEQGEVLLILDPVLSEISVARASARVAEAKAVLDEARRQRDEAGELVKKKHISASDHEARIAQVRIQEAALRRLQEELAQEKELLRRHTVYAPFSGVVAQKLTEVGQWVETSTTLMKFEETSVVRVDVPVPQTWFTQISLGTPASISFDAFPRSTYEGSVSMKIPSGSASTRTFPVRIDLDNSDGRIGVGMSARVVFKLEVSTDALLVPRDVLVRKPDGSNTVWVIQELAGQHRAKPVPVRTGRVFREYVEIITSDLQEGDRVVVRGNEILHPGQSVKIVEQRARYSEG